MEFKELLDFVEYENKIIDEKYKKTLISSQEKILARTVKLSEEFGELCNEVLAFGGNQRNEKLDKNSNLYGEFADVIITTLLLADSMDVNIQRALKEKIEQLKLRQIS